MEKFLKIFCCAIIPKENLTESDSDTELDNSEFSHDKTGYHKEITVGDKKIIIIEDFIN